MISLVRLEWNLLDGFESVFLQEGHLSRKADFWRRCRVDTARFHGNDTVPAVFEEVVGIEYDNSGLIWLCNVGEHDVDLRQQHSVFSWKTSVLHDGYTRSNTRH